MRATTKTTAAAFALLGVAAAAPAGPFRITDTTTTVKRQDGGKIVAAHFMVGIVANRESAADYDSDMKNAKVAGIDAFALNIAPTRVDSYTETQLNYAYESAANNDMKVFISFDYNYFGTDENADVGAMLKTFCAKPGQLQVEGKCFASSFNGDTDAAKLFNAKEVRAAAGTDLYLVPNLSPTGIRDATAVDDVEGSFNWIGWDSNGANRAPTAEANVTTSDFDAKYTEWLGDKTYMAPVSPWFFTNYASGDYPKQWTFPSDLLWFRRWNEILASAPKMVEIITWNDFGESHYVGPESKHTVDSGITWTEGMFHESWLEMAMPFIEAFKAGKKEVSVSEDKLVYWYRKSPKASCGAFDGIETLQDAVFVVALLKSAGTVTLNSGSNTQSFEAPAGATAYQVDMGTGKPTFTLQRDGADVISGTGKLEITDDCGSPINLNAYVGTVTGVSNAARDDAPPVKSSATTSTAAVAAGPSTAVGGAPFTPKSKSSSSSASTSSATKAAPTGLPHGVPTPPPFTGALAVETPVASSG